MVCEVCRTGPERETEAGAFRAAKGTNYRVPFGWLKEQFYKWQKAKSSF